MISSPRWALLGKMLSGNTFYYEESLKRSTNRQGNSTNLGVLQGSIQNDFQKVYEYWEKCRFAGSLGQCVLVRPVVSGRHSALVSIC